MEDSSSKLQLSPFEESLIKTIRNIPDLYASIHRGEPYMMFSQAEDAETVLKAIIQSFGDLGFYVVHNNVTKQAMLGITGTEDHLAEMLTLLCGKSEVFRKAMLTVADAINERRIIVAPH